MLTQISIHHQTPTFHYSETSVLCPEPMVIMRSGDLTALLTVTEVKQMHAALTAALQEADNAPK